MRSPPLEREKELGALADLRARACDGQGGLVLVQAPAGLGKSSLLAACTAGARAEGMAVLGAGGSELEQGFAFGVCRRLFEARVAAAAPQERGELLEGAAAGCAPAIAPPAPAPGPVAEEQLFPILHGLFWLTSNLADRGPLLLALDDAHWADRASLRFLLYLAERVEDLAVALVVCVREGEPTAAGDMLDRLRGGRSVAVARPAPLSDRAVDALVRRRLPGAVPALGEAIARSTAGNPLFVTELVGELVREDIEPDARAAAGIEGRAPQAVLPALLARVARLGEGAVALARSAALLGDDATLAQAAELARLERDPAVRAADALAGAGIQRH
jgi:predicted ATPase